MWCIFCKKDRKPSEEHIIPRNVGGSIITYQVCEVCNPILGSEVDSVLNKHRHIFDAYEKIKSDKKPELKFNFTSSTFRSADGAEIKVASNNLSKKIQPTETSENQFTIE